MLPGDDVVPDPQLVTDHAITINARATDVWPWLTQMGWHLGGYYGPEWVDRLLFPQNWASLDALDPDLLRHLEVGDLIPDGEPGTAYYEVTRCRRRTCSCCTRRRTSRPAGRRSTARPSTGPGVSP